MAQAPGADDGAYVRRTYAHFLRVGVEQDGVAEGIEHTRHKHEPPEWGAKVRSRILEGDALQSDLKLHETLDCFGFYDASPMHARKEPLVLPLKAGTAPSADAVHAARQRLAAQRRRRDARRVQKWHKMLRFTEGKASLDGASPQTVRRRVYKGIPDAWRGAAWRVLAQCPDAPSPAALLATPSAHDIQIDLDIPRTIRGHVHFRTRYGRGQCDLFTVLHAASLTCNDCGYCQGMGPLAAILLLYMVPEDAYAMMTQLHTTYAFHGLFRPGFPGLREELYVLRTLLAQHAPRATAALEAFGVAPSAFATGWYMTLFSGVLPFSTQLRLWDAFLLDGHDVVTLAAVAIVQTLEPRLSTPPTDWLVEALSAPILPDDDDAFLHWIGARVHEPRTAAAIRDARRAWAARCAAGTADAEFL
ncbi:uncharacterized protein MJAP1_002832 [Malassezia japonica]|uniref:Rab-GAP TBC domain-containing protein n=1 Tax=Malassezia japonica TaxID=223818 RepID=A0AAF0F4V4_9BASI|nr:uncharacterized protein MJAP1_002832 [Malassezia japonica]WFD39851.1 hypothetical protein MJAP1_002832 [Malassezia japonica]